MHYLRRLQKRVDKSHPGLGKTIAFATICIKARKCLIIIAPAGTGKSTITNFIISQHPEAMRIDAISEAGLSMQQEEFKGFKGLVVIDDMGKLGSWYRRMHSLIALSELCYSHYVRSYMYGNPIEISDYHGSAVFNAQPAIMSSLIASDEWEVVLQDKTVRYYHLYRPKAARNYPPQVGLDWGLDFDLVATSHSRGTLWKRLVSIAQVQWSDARVIEHLEDLLRATAALDGRREVLIRDYLLLLELIRPLTLEKYLINKMSFEAGRIFDSNLLAVMIEFATWGNLSLNQLARDYKVRPQRAIELLQTMGSAWVGSSFRSQTIKPSPEMVHILKEAGVKW